MRAPAASHTDRYEFRCSAGHRMLYHQPCWRKATGGAPLCQPVLHPAGCTWGMQPCLGPLAALEASRAL